MALNTEAPEKEMLKIGFLGGGRMAYAMANGFLKAGLTKPEHMIASCHPSDLVCAKEFESLGSTAVFTNIPVVNKSNVVMISVKPYVVQQVIEDIKNDPKLKDKLFISIAMGITLKTLHDWLPDGCRIIRVMPNTPALVGKGAAVLVPGTNASPSDINLAKSLFEAVGTCDVGTEYMLDAVTALSGSGPAYVYLMIEALADGGVKMGLPRDLSQKLAAQTVAGAASMVLESPGIHPATLRDNVTSPGGSTAAALHHLENNAFRGAIIGAVEAGTKRCQEVASGSK